MRYIVISIAFFFKLALTAAEGGWCEACGAKLASLAFEEAESENFSSIEI